VKNFDRIKSPDDETPSPLAFLQQQQQLNLAQYQINLMVDNTDSADGAPVVYEEHPYYHNLMGRIDYSSTLGQLITNFSLIKAGALHRANGGYLVLQARDLLMQPFSWEALKRALRSRKASIGASHNSTMKHNILMFHLIWQSTSDFSVF
jgi:predicted ATP-dependent protease